MKIGIITTSSCDYGYYVPILRELEQDSFFELKIFVLGMHLSPRFGNTYKNIKDDGFEIVSCEPSISNFDQPVDISKNMSETIEVFANILNKHSIDTFMCLGDRYEMLAAALATIPFDKPLIHIHGGELTEGAIDNKFRHALTKISDLHFTSCERYKKRVIQMGAHPSTVYNVGSPTIELIKNTQFFSIEELKSKLDIDFSHKTILGTFHPVTNELAYSERYIKEYIAALKYSGFQIIITLGNADTYWSLFHAELQKMSDNKNIRVVANLGSRLYLSCVNHCYMMVGNSSSGIIEAASLSKPVVNIGTRQKGRECSGNVIHCNYSKESIGRAILKAENIIGRHFENIYEQNNTAKNIVATIKTFDFKKQYGFYENSNNWIWEHSSSPHK